MNYYDKKQKLIEIFEDTQKFYNNNQTLINNIKYSKENTIIYKNDNYPDISNHSIYNDTIIEINKLRSFECAIKEQKINNNLKIGVLNFASATNPGGGVLKGSSAQEEALCRCSTLYFSLSQSKCYKEFYNINRNLKDALHNDMIIYSPNIQIIKTDEQFPKRLNEKEFVNIDIISCAAPNLRESRNSYADSDTGNPIKINNNELYKIHLQRGKHILHIAAYHNIDTLILGAFGCGAFKNDPYIVAKAYKEVIKEYKKYFKKIIFAIYCNKYYI